MTARWRDISELYHAALSRDAAERGRFLTDACGGDDNLRREVESLLEYEESAAHFFATAAVVDRSSSDSGSPRRLPPGHQLGSYRIRTLLGVGGMGEVYAAYDPRLDREVAIKVLPPAFADDAERLRRFEQEARAAAALNHPNIVAIHDVGREERTPYIVMERVPGETLAAMLAEGRPSIDRALEIGAAIADGLAAAHARGVVHRDLKPGNVMVLPDGRIKVLDFGLARTAAVPKEQTTMASPVAAPAPMTRAGQLIGTAAYMAPEQLLGQPGDHRADIYALGVILYEMVTGRRPFEGSNFITVGLNVLAGPAPNACEIDSAIAPAVGELIARVIAKETSARPQSAAALKSELDSLRALLADSQGQEASARSSRWARVLEYVEWTAAAVVVAAGVYAALGWFRFQTAPPNERPIIAVLPLANLTGDPSKDYVGVGIAESLTTQLARLSSVAVVSRETSADTAANPRDLAQVARELGANLIVQGSFREAGERVRVNARMVRPSGMILWAGDAEAAAGDLFGIELSLANALVGALRVRVEAAERQQLETRPTEDPEALDAYWRGTALLERPDQRGADAAVAAFDEAVKEDPRFAAAHAALGRAYVRKYGETNEATWMTKAALAVSKALEIDPKVIEVRLSLAAVYTRTGQDDAAIEEFRKVLALQPTSDEAHRGLASVFERQGRTAEARAEYEAAIRARPEYWRNFDALGGHYLRTRQLKEAIEAFERVSALRPDDAQNFQRLGTAYGLAGDNVRARENTERSLALDPTSPASYANLATILYAEGRVREAAAAYEAVVKLRPNRALYRRNLGDAYAKLGRTADARAQYEQAVTLAAGALAVNPADTDLMSQLAVYEAKVGSRADAERHIERALAINPKNPAVLYRRAVVFALLGRPDAAIAPLSAALALGESRERARDDDDFAALRGRPDFQKLLATTPGAQAKKE